MVSSYYLDFLGSCCDVSFVRFFPSILAREFAFPLFQKAFQFHQPGGRHFEKEEEEDEEEAEEEE